MALRVNLGWALWLGAPRLGGACLVAAVASLLLRRLEAPALTRILTVLGLLALAGLWTAWRVWPRRYRIDNALSRLDADAGLGGALVAAAEGAAEWPAWRSVPVRMRWRLARIWPGLAVAPLVLGAAFLVSVQGQARRTTSPAAPPLAWQDLKDALQILEEEEPLVDPADLERWRAQLDELAAQPPEAWFEEENLEAADAVWSELRRTVAKSEQAVAPVERALQDPGAALEDASRQTSQQDLHKAMEALEGASLDPKLADKLSALDPKSLPSMSPAERDALKSQLARARAAGRRARGEAEGEGEPGFGAVKRGPGTAPIELEPDAARRLSERTETLDSERDPARDALSDVVRVDAVAPEVDLDAYRGPTEVDGTEHLGRGGQAVWGLVLDPDEQALLERYFE